jgi:hypothetical protein
VPRLYEFYRGICLTTEEKAWENLSQGSRGVPVGTMKTVISHIKDLVEFTIDIQGVSKRALQI